MGECVAKFSKACMLSWTTCDIHLCALPRTKGMRLHSLKCMQMRGEQ